MVTPLIMLSLLVLPNFLLQAVPALRERSAELTVTGGRCFLSVCYRKARRAFGTSHSWDRQFPRLRIGIGDQGGSDAVDYVLSRFRSPTCRHRDSLILASQAVAVWVTQGIDPP